MAALKDIVLDLQDGSFEKHKKLLRHLPQSDIDYIRKNLRGDAKVMFNMTIEDLK